MKFWAGFLLGSICGFLVTAAILLFAQIYDHGLTSELIESASAVGALAAVVVAVITYRDAVSRDESLHVLEEAKLLLQRAYEVLSENGGAVPPKPNRYVWLTAARLIAAAKQASQRITEEVHRDSYSEHEQYWRAQINMLIAQILEDKVPDDYYAETERQFVVPSWEPGERAPLAKASLKIVLDFCTWPKELEDRVEDVSFSVDEIKKMITFGPRKLGRLFKAYHEARKTWPGE